MGALRISVIIIMLFIIMLAGCKAPELPENEAEQNVPAEGNEPVVTVAEPPADALPPGLDEIPVSRALAAKMLALAFLTPDEIDDTASVIAYTDVPKDSWHFKYINAAASLGLMVGGRGEFRPESPLSINEAEVVIERVVPDSRTRIQITPETKDLPISCALWQQLFINALTELSESGGKTLEERFGLRGEDLVVLATPENAEALPQWSVVTDKGWYFLRGMSADAYTDGKISVYAKKNEIVAVAEADAGEVLLESAYVEETGSGLINVYAGGVRRTFELVGGDVSREIADVRISGQTAEIVSVPTDKKAGLIKRAADKYVELEDGMIAMGKDVPVYLTDGGAPVFKGIGGLIPGTEATFYLSGGKIIAAVTGKHEPEKMRVLIASEDYGTSVHTSVEIGASCGFTITSEEGEKKYKQGDTAVFNKENNSDLFSSDRIRITPDDENGLLEIRSIKRSGEIPKYRGAIELSKEGEAFIIINELPFEQYLYSVVSSQIPEALGETAARAQAVASRSAARCQFYENNLRHYGANVDDSVKYQLYNAAPETEMSFRAVEETKGKVLVYNGDTLRPAFFLASAGYTANRGEAFVKPGGTKFPSDTPEYLRAVKQYEGDYGDLSIEQNARKFFMDVGINAYEKDFSWFRWNVKMGREEVEASINANVGNIGQLTNIEVLKRGEGGNIMELKVTGINGERVFKSESVIRGAIRPYQYAVDKPPVLLNRADGTSVPNYAIMPSAFYVFDIERDEAGEIVSISFYGGGNGHGVGMSQCGAKAMADGGAAYEDILKHYFTGAEVK